MPHSNIIIGSDSQNGEMLSINFTKRSFHDFIHSLVSTPREERKHFEAGFDLDKPNLRLIVDRLDQHISTNYDTANREFECTIAYPEGSEVSVGGYDQLFATEEMNHEDPIWVGLTISYLIGFRREGGERSYEKQVISLWFGAGAIGQVSITVRSTEITWSTGIIGLLTSEVRKLEKKTAGRETPVQNRLLFLTPLFRQSPLSSGDREQSLWLFSRIMPLVVILLLSLTTIPLFLTNSNLSTPVIYDENSGVLVQVDGQELIAEHGAKMAAEMLSVGRTFNYLDVVEFADGRNSALSPTSIFFTRGGPASAVLGCLVFIFCLACFRHARSIDNHYLARIIFADAPQGIRPKLKATDGLVVSLGSGLAVSLLSTVISAMVLLP